jgi:thioredoxin 1
MGVKQLKKCVFTLPIVREREQKKGTNKTSKSEFDAAIHGSDKLVVVDAFAEWCGPCKVIAPKVHAWSEEHTDVDFVKFDVDESPDVAQELGIRAMPTFLFFKNGEKITEVVGVNPPALEAAIKGNK